MRPDEYVDFDAAGLAELVHRGEITPEALTDAAIARIDALNGQLNAVVERGDEMARAAAATIDRRAPLAGVPFLAKDVNIDVAGLRLTSSCRWLAQLPAATVDAPLAARWRAAGLSILGRTNTPEFAGEFVTEPTWRGPTHNPWDLTRSPGGSSGGAAAAVASGMVPLAHGTDSGGSIRVPAAACGLVGLKPSRGLTPVGPHLDELAGGLDCEHVLTRSIRDTALMLDLTAGPEATSRVAARAPAAPFVAALSAELCALRIGVCVIAPGGMRPNAEIGAAVDGIAKILARLGHHLGEFRFPASAAIGDPAAVTAELPLLTGRIDGRTESFDLERWNTDSYGYAPYTEIFNVTGSPAMSLPLAVSTSGLPIGVQLAAPLGQDARLLTLGAWLERELPWAPRLEELRRRFVTR